MRPVDATRILGIALVVLGGLWLLRALEVISVLPIGPLVLITVGVLVLTSALRRQPHATATPGWESEGWPPGSQAASPPPHEPLDQEQGARSGGDAFTQGAPTRLLVPREDAVHARIVLQHGAGTLRLRRASGSTSVCEVRGDGTAEQLVRRDGDRVEVTIRPLGEVGGVISRMRAVDWDVFLAEDVALDIEIKTGAAKVEADLTGLSLERLAVRTGASEVDLALPDRGRPSVSISAGAADVRIRVPQALAAAVRNRSALASFSIDERRFPRTGGVYRSPNFDESADRVAIDVEGGVASFNVR